MKKLFYSFAVVMAMGALLLTSSCKKEEDEPQLKTITETAQANSDFSILVQALTRSDLSTNYATVLNGTGPYTVFAPTNAAFQSLLTELNVASLNDIPAATLEEVLKYHVVSGKVLSNQLSNGQEVTTLQGSKFTIGLTGGAKITDGQARTTNITTTDLECSNGVIHVVDRVLLP